jgi:hypothetical protein
MKKCVGCGYCCIKAKCAGSQRLYPDAKICPQLHWQGDRYFCGLMFLPGIEGATYRKELAAGEGCYSGLNSWRKDVCRRDGKEKTPYDSSRNHDTIC